MAYSVSALGTLNPPMKRIVKPLNVVTLCCCLALFTTACGQRGPLYLPEPETPAVEAPEEGQEESESAEKTEDGDDEGAR
jgi:predicted small lipoprotein YifL